MKPLAHTAKALVGVHVRIERDGFTHLGTITSAGRYPGSGPEGGLACMFNPDLGNRTGFHLPPSAVVVKVKTPMRIVLDRDCPVCGWPELFAQGDNAPEVMGCNHCGWSAPVEAAQR